MFGAFAPLPIRLTATSTTEGWTATEQSRVANDLAAAWRTVPLAIMTVEVDTSSVSLVSYTGRNGVGSAYAPTLTYTSATQPCRATWNGVYDDDLQVTQPWSIRHADVELQWTGSGAVGASLRSLTTSNVSVVASAGITTPYRMTITIYGDWGEPRNVGDYGGDINKRDCQTEAFMPYVAQWWHAIRSSRGTAYTKKTYTLVDGENLALARLMASAFSRNAEKLVANSQPSRADEKLDYWVNVLAIPNKPNDPRWLLRERCALHYQSALGPTVLNVRAAIESLLGDAFVGLFVYEGSDLDNPPLPTYWPSGTHGPSSFSIGGATWLSRRSHIRIEATQPPGISLSEFIELMDVQMFQLLDRMLPSWVTWSWSEGSDGFRVGVDRIGVDGL